MLLFCGIFISQRFYEPVIEKQKGKTIYDSIILCNRTLFLVNSFKLMIIQIAQLQVRKLVRNPEIKEKLDSACQRA